MPLWAGQAIRSHRTAANSHRGLLFWLVSATLLFTWLNIKLRIPLSRVPSVHLQLAIPHTSTRRHPNMEPLNLQHLLTRFSDHWSQRTIGTLNDYEIKLAKLLGEFVWHSHPYTDEMFLIVYGTLNIPRRRFEARGGVCGAEGCGACE